MHLSRSRYTVFALLIAASACGGSDDSQPPLLLTEANAPSVAAEALIAASQTSTGAGSPLGGAAAAATRPAHELARRAAHDLMSRGPAAAFDTMTEACAAGGSITTDSSGMSGTVTFNNCQEDANTKINGSLKLTIKTSSGGGSSEVAFSVSVNITVTAGKLTFSESGGYDMVLNLGSADAEFELSGKRLTVSVSGGTVNDKLTLSDFDIDVKADSTVTPAEQSESIDFDIDSTRLKGHIAVATNAPVKQLVGATPAREYPHAGQVVVTGANKSRLQITIAGDETYQPPTGEGQVKLELDSGNGSFAAAIWVSWAALRAEAGGAP